MTHGSIVPTAAFVTVTGTDAFSFLQALVSADLERLADGDAVHSLLLTPQGKLDVDFRLLRVGDDAWLDCAPGLGAQLAASLNRVPHPGEGRRSSTAPASSACCRGSDRSRSTSPSACTACRPRGAPTSSGHARVLPTVEPLVDPEAFDAWRIERGHPGAAGRHRRVDHPAGGVPRAGRGVLHQGMLPRAGAGLPHRQSRPREPLPPALHRDRR